MALAAMARERRRRRGWSQSDLAEATRLSVKTVQRLEAGEPVAPGSRRAVLTALDIDPEELAELAELADPGPEPGPAPSDWIQVEDAGALFASLETARRVEVELDREGWRLSRQDRPWYRKEIVIAIGDPTTVILEIADRAKEISRLPPGRRAKTQDELAEAVRAAIIRGWGLASSVDDDGQLHLYIGSPATAAARVRAPAGEE